MCPDVCVGAWMCVGVDVWVYVGVDVSVGVGVRVLQVCWGCVLKREACACHASHIAAVDCK